jgi:hypothetical protein
MQKRFEPGDIVTINVPQPNGEYGHWIVIEHRTEMHPDGSTAWVKCLSPCGTAYDWSPRYVSHVVSYDI